MPPPIVRGGGFPLFRRVPKNWDIGPIGSLFFILATQKTFHTIDEDAKWHLSWSEPPFRDKRWLASIFLSLSCQHETNFVHVSTLGSKRVTGDPIKGSLRGNQNEKSGGGRDRFSCKVCLEIGFLSKLPPRDKSENYEPNSNKGCPNLPEFPWFMRWNFPKFCAHGQNHISRRVVQ